MIWEPVPVSAQMAPGAEEREVDPREDPFLLIGRLSPAAPVEGEEVEIEGEIWSRVRPHSRVVVRFWIDGRKREETAYVISPFAESIVIHEWPAARGEHTIRIEVASPLGVLYATWEHQITVQEN